MATLLKLAVFSLVLPVCCVAVIRNLYSETEFLGAAAFLSYIDKAGLTKLLKDPRGADITVFAPNNQAFQSLPPGVFSDLLEDVPLLIKVLQNHVVKQVVYSPYVKAKGTMVLPTLSGQQLTLTFSKKTSSVQVDTATVTSPDQNVNNGVVHVVNKVLLPQEVLAALRKPQFRLV